MEHVVKVIVDRLVIHMVINVVRDALVVVDIVIVVVHQKH